MRQADNAVSFFRDHLSRLEFVSELETLGLTYTFASFTSCSKSEIVKTVLTLKNKVAVRLATRMSRYFDIQSDVVWSNILTKMCSLEMVRDWRADYRVAPLLYLLIL